MWHRIEGWIHKHEVIIVVLVVITLLRIPSLFEPYWYGDEGIYLAVGQAINRGQTLYRDIHDNKPPLLYLAAAAAGGSLYWFKFIAGAVNLTSIAVFANLVNNIFGKKNRRAVAAIWVFALATTLPVWEGNIANAELFFLLPTVTAVSLLWKQGANYKRVAAAGLLIGVGGLFKMPALLEAAVWPLVWLATGEKQWWAKTMILVSATSAPVLLSGIYFQLTGAGGQYLAAAWAQNLPYLSSWNAGEGRGIFSLPARAAAAGVVVLGFLAARRRIGRDQLVLGIWGVITIFAALLSGRPYPHYLLQTAGVLGLAGGWLAGQEARKKIVPAGLLALIAAAMVLWKFYIYPTGGYYVNFLRWAFGQKSRAEYFSWFNPNVTRNYEVAATVRAGTRDGEKIFVWGDAPEIYALARRPAAGRYVARYHIRDFKEEEETIRRLAAETPKYIIVLNEKGELPGLEDFLNEGYRLEKQGAGTEVYRRLGMLGWRY